MSTAQNKSPEAKPRKYNITISQLPFTYFHLCLRPSTPIVSQEPVDIITARTHLTSALQQYLGLTGTAIPIDFLKVEGRDVWIRLPREDSSAVHGALSQWMGRDGSVSWQVKGKGESIGALNAGDGRDLFEQ